MLKNEVTKKKLTIKRLSEIKALSVTTICHHW